MTDLASLTADQLAEKVRGVEAMHGEWSRERLASLTELVRRLKTAEDALSEISASALDPAPVGDGFVHAIRVADHALAAIRPNPEP